MEHGRTTFPLNAQQQRDVKRMAQRIMNDGRVPLITSHTRVPESFSAGENEGFDEYVACLHAELVSRTLLPPEYIKCACVREDLIEVSPSPSFAGMVLASFRCHMARNNTMVSGSLVPYLDDVNEIVVNDAERIAEFLKSPDREIEFLSLSGSPIHAIPEYGDALLIEVVERSYVPKGDARLLDHYIAKGRTIFVVGSSEKRISARKRLHFPRAVRALSSVDQSVIDSVAGWLGVDPSDVNEECAVNEGAMAISAPVRMFVGRQLYQRSDNVLQNGGRFVQLYGSSEMDVRSQQVSSAIMLGGCAVLYQPQGILLSEQEVDVYTAFLERAIERVYSLRNPVVNVFKAKGAVVVAVDAFATGLTPLPVVTPPNDEVVAEIEKAVNTALEDSKLVFAKGNIVADPFLTISPPSATAGDVRTRPGYTELLSVAIAEKLCVTPIDLVVDRDPCAGSFHVSLRPMFREGVIRDIVRHTLGALRCFDRGQHVYRFNRTGTLMETRGAVNLVSRAIEKALSGRWGSTPKITVEIMNEWPDEGLVCISLADKGIDTRQNAVETLVEKMFFNASV